MAKKNTPYAKCAFCGATLDKGERCDCEESAGREPAVKLVKTPEQEAEAAKRKAWVLNRIGRRMPESD